MKNKINRRGFLKIIGAAVVGVTLFPVINSAEGLGKREWWSIPPEMAIDPKFKDVISAQTIAEFIVSSIGNRQETKMIIKYDVDTLQLLEIAVVNSAGTRRKGQFKLEGEQTRTTITGINGGRDSREFTDPMLRLILDEDNLLFLNAEIGLG